MHILVFNLIIEANKNELFFAMFFEIVLCYLNIFYFM